MIIGSSFPSVGLIRSAGSARSAGLVRSLFWLPNKKEIPPRGAFLYLYRFYASKFRNFRKNLAQRVLETSLKKKNIFKYFKKNVPPQKIKIISLRVIPSVTLYWNIFVINSDILSALRSLDFIRIILSSSSLLLVRGPAVTIVIYQAKLIQTDSRYAWFKTISDARASPDARRLEAKIWKI